MKQKARLLALVLLAGVWPGRALASSGRKLNVQTEGLTQYVFSLQHNLIYLFTLESATDTAGIIDLFTYPDGKFIAEAKGGVASPPDGGPTPFSAALQFAVGTNDMKVYGIIRGAPGSVPVQDTLRIRAFQGSPRETPLLDSSRPATFSPVASTVPISGGLVAKSHVMTVEQPAGPNDTVLIVLSNGVPLRLDDDNGVAAMSWMHLEQGCAAAGCSAIVAVRMNMVVPAIAAAIFRAQIPPNPKGFIPTQGPSTIIWDEDIHTADVDHDGLGDSLERAIGSSVANADTDHDGIRDDFEVIGKDDPALLTSLTKFPLYGADPNIRDLFLEMDWTPSWADTSSACTPGLKNASQFLLPDTQALVRTASSTPAFFAPDFSLHVDIGSAAVNSPGPSDQFLAGNWGGAPRRYPMRR